jgi:hypothetical protein
MFHKVQYNVKRKGKSEAGVARTALFGGSELVDGTREEVFMEGPLEPSMGPSLADVLLCTFESTNAGFSLFPFRKLLSWE